MLHSCVAHLGILRSSALACRSLYTSFPLHFGLDNSNTQQPSCSCSHVRHLAAGEHITGEPVEETPFQFIPARAALQVYACGVLISIGAALCFGSRQRRYLKNTRGLGPTSQFIYQASPATIISKPERKEALLQPLLPESSV